MKSSPQQVSKALFAESSSPAGPASNHAAKSLFKQPASVEDRTKVKRQFHEIFSKLILGSGIPALFVA